ncbi:unnamed protein product [Cochlearia groenlandica]
MTLAKMASLAFSASFVCVFVATVASFDFLVNGSQVMVLNPASSRSILCRVFNLSFCLLKSTVALYDKLCSADLIHRGDELCSSKLSPVNLIGVVVGKEERRKGFLAVLSMVAP